jgi:hypothetical protein
VEKPFRDKQVFSREIIFSASLVIVAFFMAFGFVVIQFEGLKNRKYMVTHKELDYATHWIGWHDCNIDGFQQDKDGGCKVVKQSDSIHVLVIGDSHAGHYASGFLELAKMKHKNIAIILRAGCFPGLNTGGGDIFNCEYDYIQKALEYAVDTPLIETVILSGFGISKISGYELVDGTSNSINPERLSEFEAGLTRSLELLSKGKKSVVLIADNPEIPTRKPGSCLRRDTCDTLKYPRENYDRRNAAYNAILHRAKNKFDNLRVVYPHDTLCDLKYCYAFLSGNLLYQNGDHLTPFAGRLLIQKMFK